MRSVRGCGIVLTHSRARQRLLYARCKVKEPLPKTQFKVGAGRCTALGYQNYQLPGPHRQLGHFLYEAPAFSGCADFGCRYILCDSVSHAPGRTQ